MVLIPLNRSLSPNSTFTIDPAFVHSLQPRQTPQSRQSSPFETASHFSPFGSGSQLSPFIPANQSPVFSPVRDKTPHVKIVDDEAHRNRRIIRNCPSRPGWKFRRSSCVPDHGPRLFVVTCTTLGHEPGSPEITTVTRSEYTSCREDEICVDGPNFPFDTTRVHCVNYEYHLKTAKPGQADKGPFSGRVGSVAPRDIDSGGSRYILHVSVLTWNSH